MSTGYSWEGLRQLCATLLSARHVPEHLCGGPCPQRGAITSVRPLPLALTDAQIAAAARQLLIEWLQSLPFFFTFPSL